MTDRWVMGPDGLDIDDPPAGHVAANVLKADLLFSYPQVTRICLWKWD